MFSIFCLISLYLSFPLSWLLHSLSLSLSFFVSLSPHLFLSSTLTTPTLSQSQIIYLRLELMLSQIQRDLILDLIGNPWIEDECAIN